MNNKKLFRKPNIIDILIIIAVIAALIYLTLRFLDTSDSTDAAANTDVTAIKYEVTIRAMREEMYYEIMKNLPAPMTEGDNEREGTIVTARATPCQVDILESRDPYSSTATYKILPEPDSRFVDVVFECTASVPADSVRNEVGTQEVRVGKIHILRNRWMELSGVITALEVVN